MTTLPNFSSYGNYKSDNYGAHTLEFRMPNITLYYSYKTLVAFYTMQDGLVVRENDWGVTTGKHLNWIDGGDKKNRLSANEFTKRLQAALDRK